SRDVDFFENKFLHDSTSTNEMVTQIPQDNSGPNLNSNNKRNMEESSSAPRKNLDEEVYMKQPKGVVLPGLENKVFKLKKSSYGLKQAPKQWHDKFDKSILSNDFTYNSSDRCIYSKFTKDYGVILCLYVDDIMIVRTNMEGINETKKFMSLCFQMKDMNEIDTILGIKVKRYSGSYALNQCPYIDKIIDKFQHVNIEEANTPYEPSCKLAENDGRSVAQIEYASLIGCSDASWITGSSDSKSTTGLNFYTWWGAVCSGLKKQTCITHSTIDAEFLAPTAACKEEEWLRNIAGLRMFGNDTLKLDRMDVMNFTRWKEKMKFLLTAFKVYYVLEGPHVGLMTEEEQRKREQDETLCRGYLLSCTWNSSKDNKKDKKSLFDVVCYKFGEKGHIKCYCNNPKKKNQNSNKKDEYANAIEQVDTIEIIAMWYDSGATTYVCNKRDLFKTYKETEDEHEVMMGDNHTSKVIGSRTVEIQFTSGKKLTLINVLYVPNIRKNKVCKSGVKAVIESDKVIMSKASVFVGKAYAYDGMFKLNINKITSSTYLPDCSFISSFNNECSTFNLWHNRLGHIRTMKDMLKQGIISYNGEHKDKCEICVQAKMKRKPFPKVDRQSEILELVHFDICELNGQLTRGGNRTSPYTPQQNGVAERKNRVLQDMINAMLVSTNLLKNLWGEGLLTACHVPLPNTSKLGPRGLKSVFVRYAKDSKSYRCLDLDSNIIVESRDVDFFENKFFHDSTSTNEIVTQIPQDNSGLNLNSNNKRNTTEPSSAPRRSEMTRKERILDPNFIDSQAIIFLVEGYPSRNSAFWKEAINDEIDFLVSNNTWELLDLPPGSKAIGCRWVFRIKYHTDGSIQTFKARVLFALASIYNLPIHQMDVKTAFLKGDLNEEVYMKQPKGFMFPGLENNVCKLKKPLYGLKQAPKQWHDKFDKSILSNGFTHNSSDICIYSKFTKDYCVILCLYVDDILIIGTNMKGISETKKFMSSCFQVKDMNEVDTILGIKDHWKAIRRVFGYVKRTRQLALYYDRFPAVLEGYSDASWITGNSDKDEFLALAAAEKAAEWLRNMLLDIKLWPQPMPAISLHCDSHSTLSRAYNKVYNGKSRHISIRHAYIKELISNGIITIEFIRSCKNLADLFTEGFPNDTVFRTTREMGLKPIE
nr:hypothetical protein [Tanacetum cinerariifolium]